MKLSIKQGAYFGYLGQYTGLTDPTNCFVTAIISKNFSKVYEFPVMEVNKLGQFDFEAFGEDTQDWPLGKLSCEITLHDEEGRTFISDTLTILVEDSLNDD